MLARGWTALADTHEPVKPLSAQGCCQGGGDKEGHQGASHAPPRRGVISRVIAAFSCHTARGAIPSEGDADFPREARRVRDAPDYSPARVVRREGDADIGPPLSSSFGLTSLAGGELVERYDAAMEAAGIQQTNAEDERGRRTRRRGGERAMEREERTARELLEDMRVARRH